MIWLFLDFDGVMHPADSSTAKFECEDALWTIIEPLAAAGSLKVVISSSWRSNFSLEEIKDMLRPELSDVVVGATPEHENAWHIGGRQAEIEEWLKNNAQESDVWVALDDMPEIFHDPCENLLICDHKTGFSSKEAALLTERFNLWRLST